jgi:hypothetical protein
VIAAAADANAGDSRVYYYAARDGKLRTVTLDDNSLYDAVGKVKAREMQEAEGIGKKPKDILGAEKIRLKI